MVLAAWLLSGAWHMPPGATRRYGTWHLLFGQLTWGWYWLHEGVRLPNASDVSLAVCCHTCVNVQTAVRRCHFGSQSQTSTYW